MSEISSKYNPDSAFIDILCSELAQPLAVITTLVELWQLGLNEPGDAEMIKQQVDTLVSTMRELRAYSDSVHFDQLTRFGENSLDILSSSYKASFKNLPLTWFA